MEQSKDTRYSRATRKFLEDMAKEQPEARRSAADCSLFDGKRFSVTIDRSRMARRYVLQVFDDLNNMTPQNEPMYAEEFRDYYGFYETWPHEFISADETSAATGSKRKDHE